MKIDRLKAKKCFSEVPLDCKLLIDKLKSCTEDELVDTLSKIKSWGCGKCELYHWIDILDIFDAILEDCCRKERANQWLLPVDLPENARKKELLLSVISFTSLLIEHSFSRHLYNSIEHLITLMSSTDMQIVLAILNLLFVFSKRSNFFSRISTENRHPLLARLNYLAENWGGKEYGFGMAECCQDLPLSSYPSSATTLNFEFYSANDNNEHHSSTTINTGSSAGGGSSSSSCNIKDEKKDSQQQQKVNSSLNTICIENVHLIDKPLATLMEEIVNKYNVPVECQPQLFAHLRLTKNFANYQTRLYCVQARLSALSILVYCQSGSVQEANTSLLYNGLIEELVDVLELKNPDLIEIKSTSLKALTAIIHLDRNSKLKGIIDCTGACSYHGFLPMLVRNCIHSLIEGKIDQFPLNFATALFSFLYHLASYESGCDALVQCGIMESLLKVIEWKVPELDYITFVTRAVRVIDLITNLDMNAFHNNNGLTIFVQRLEHEVEICRKEQPYEIEVPVDKVNKEKNDLLSEDENITEHSESNMVEQQSDSPMSVGSDQTPPQNSSSAIASTSSAVASTSAAAAAVAGPSSALQLSGASTGILQCYPQRAALFKSMLNFLKKAVQYNALAEGIRHMMYGNFPRTLRHIISNAEYYSPSLFLLATDVVSVYVYNEPSLLSTLQDNGLTDVVLHSLLVKDVPSTKEVLAALPNVFTALCLNRRGLEAFVALKPFERLFKIFLSPDYLQAMRRRRSESIGDTATTLGNSMDELMRHQPSLRSVAIKAIINLLEEICRLGSDSKYICTKSKSTDSNVGLVLTESSERVIPSNPNINNDLSSSEDEDYDDDTTTTTPPSNAPSDLVALPVSEQLTPSTSKQALEQQQPSEQQRQPIPLPDYIFNVMRFVDAILSNNSTDDHCREFLQNNGLVPLLKILKLPNLPHDFASSPACFNVASVFKSLLNLTHEKSIFVSCLEQLQEVTDQLEPMLTSMQPFEGSVLLEDMIAFLSAKKNSQTLITPPILQMMSGVHAYLIMFVHVCRTGQGDIRNISIKEWGTPLGIHIIGQLSRIYLSLVWESTLLLGLSDSTVAKGEFIKSQADRLNTLAKAVLDNGAESAASPMEVDIDPDPLCSTCGSTRTEMESIGTATTTASTSTGGGATGSGSGSGSNSKQASPFSKNTHQKCIKPLLTAASKLGRSLAELFGLLVKLCVGSPIRRRSHHSIPNQNVMPSPNSRNISRHLTLLIQNAFSWKPPVDVYIPKYRLTFYVCMMGFTTPILFDDRKYPYHLMLQNFVYNGGQDAFFQCFKAALAECVDLSDSKERQEGLIEFLESWMIMLERMSNPQMLMDSPHQMPAKTSTSREPDSYYFDPVQYLIRTHKHTFACVQELWNDKLFKLNSGTIINSLLTIVSNLLKGESIINKHINSSNTSQPNNSSASSSSTVSLTAAAAVVGVVGGGGNSAAAATAGGGGGGTATDSASTRATPAASLLPEGVDPLFLDMLTDMGFSREMAADALVQNGYDIEAATEWLLTHSRGQGNGDFEMSEEDQVIRAIAMSLNDDSSSTASGALSTTAAATTTTTDAAKTSDVMKEPQETYLQNEVPLEKSEIDRFTKAILSGTLKLLDQLPDTVFKCCELLIAVAKRNGDTWFREMVTELIGEISGNIVIILQSTCFLRDNSDKAAHEWAYQLTTLPEAHKLSYRAHLLALLFNDMKSGCAHPIAESDLLPLVVDLLERAGYLLTLVYDKEHKLTTPKWLCPLLLLLDVFEKYAVASQRRELLLATNVNRQWKFFDDRTSRWSSYAPINNKPIDDAFVNGEQFCRFNVARRRYVIQFNTMLQVNEETGSWRPVMFSSQQPPPEVIQKITEEINMHSLSDKLNKSVIDTLVILLKLPIDSDTLHAVMRLSLRLTRDHYNASVFAELGGISTILSLNRSTQFVGIVSMTSLLIRHVLEDKHMLRSVMEKIIRSQASSSMINSREMHYIFRYFNPAASRSVELFKELAKNILRINPFNKKLDEDDERTATFLRALPQKPTESSENTVVLSRVSRHVICELLNLLPLKHAKGLKLERELKANPSCAEELSKKGPIFGCSAIISLLAELIHSYHAVAKVVCDHSYHRGYTDAITEDCSALSFILDHLVCMPVTTTPTGTASSAATAAASASTDKECASLSKLLFAALASVTYSADVHQWIVTEIKSSLNRAIAANESPEKHAKIQALSSLILVVVEACPYSNVNPYKSNTLSLNANSIIKLMSKRGLITDLAKVIQSLDLSSPHMSTTVNSLLKTLEYLSKTLNYPPHLYAPRSSNRSRSEVSNGVLQSGEQAAANNAQEMMEEDVDNDQRSNTTTGNSGNAQMSNESAPVEHETSTVSEDLHSSSLSGGPSVNVDDNGHNVLFVDLDDLHTRSGTFTSDDLRTDDDEDDDVMQHSDSANRHSELHDNTANSNCVESDSSDDSHSDDEDEDDDDDDDDVDDEEEDEDEEDAAGSAQEEDQEEEDDEDDQLEDDDDEDTEEYLNDILDDSFRNYPESNVFFNMEDIFPSLLIRHNERYNFAPFPASEDISLNNDNSSTQMSVSSQDVLVQHPLMSNNLEIATNASHFYSISQSAGASTAGGASNTRHQMRPAIRSRTIRALMGTPGVSNWNIAPRNNTTSVILHRLLGSNFLPQDLVNGISSRGGSHLISNNFDMLEEDLYHGSPSYSVNYATGGGGSGGAGGGGQSSSLNNLPSAMCRWYEECRVLDGEYMFDAILLVKGEIMKCLEAHKQEDLKEKEKDKKKDDPKITSLIQEIKSRTAAAAAASGGGAGSTTDGGGTAAGSDNNAGNQDNNTTQAQSMIDEYNTSNAMNPMLVEQPIEDLHAHIEELANSVINQVLEPSSANVPVSVAVSGTSSITRPVTRSQTLAQVDETAQQQQQLSSIDQAAQESNSSDTTTTTQSDLIVESPMDALQVELSQPPARRPFGQNIMLDVREFFERPHSPISPLVPDDQVNRMLDYSPPGLMEHSDQAEIGVGVEEQIEQQEDDTSGSSGAQDDDTVVEEAAAVGASTDASAAASTDTTEPSASQTTTTATTYNLTPEERAILGDQEIPAGVDPSFLAALPENLRQEVIAEQFRLQRLNSSRQQQSSTATGGGGEAGAAAGSGAGPSTDSANASSFAEVSAEFLAALPPNIQEEVLAQQRAEQQRLAAQNSNPEAPVDPNTFFRTLPPALRRQVLSDLDDSQLRLLSADIASEARTLRQELELRHRQFQERIFSSSTALSRIIRSATSSRTRYAAIHAFPNHWSYNSRTPFGVSVTTSGGGSGGGANSTGGGSNRHNYASIRIPRNSLIHRSIKGKHLLDYDSLSSLLILLFIHDTVLNSARLHRVIRNLCFHLPTRQWVVQSLLEIMERTKESVERNAAQSGHNALTNELHSSDVFPVKLVVQNPSISWLSISLESAFGSKTNVFYIHKSPHTVASSSSSSKKVAPFTSCSIYIHPQAAAFVCRNVLDILIFLSKTFPDQFIGYTPQSVMTKNLSSSSLNALTSGAGTGGGNVGGTGAGSASTQVKVESQDPVTITPKSVPNFFDVLMRHDIVQTSKKTKSSKHSLGSSTPMQVDSDSAKPLVDQSPFSQLMTLLSHQFIKSNFQLTDRLIRLLLHVTYAMVAEADNRKDQPNATNELNKFAELEKTLANEAILKLVVDVLITKACSDEGLADATSLLIKLSTIFTNCRVIFYQLLIEGVRQLGHSVYNDISALTVELGDLLKKLKKEGEAGASGSNDLLDKNAQKGLIQDRYSNQTIIVKAATTSKHNIFGKEVQLPSMSTLISKSSSQFLFLRILKIIMHIRDIAQKAKSSAAAAVVAAVVAAAAGGGSSSSSSSIISSTNATTSAPSSSAATVVSDASSSQSIKTESTDSKLDQRNLCNELMLDKLWDKLSECLCILSEAPDDHAVLVLQPAVEAFFLVHAPARANKNDPRTEPVTQQLAHLNQSASGVLSGNESVGNISLNDPYQSSVSSPSSAASGNTGDANSRQVANNLSQDTQKFLSFAEMHRVVLNQILRQSSVHLASGPFAVLVDHTRILDFDVKRRYFRQELDRLDHGVRRDDLAVHIRRENVFEDSFRELNRRTPEEWKNRFYIVFEGEEGQDAGGLLREWYTIISREIFNPNYALFTTSPGDRVTYMINSASHCNSNHLSYFKFVGRVIAKAVYDNKLLDCYFTRSFYNHILGKLVKYTDMESEDFSFFQGLKYLLEHNVKDEGLEFTFSLETQEFGVTEIRDLIPNGRNIAVTEENKHEYVRLVCQEKMTGSIKKQLNSFLEGFYEIIPKRLISIFNEHELELLISGLPNIDIDDLKNNTEYHKYQSHSLQIQWFWRALRSFDQADRAKFLQFVTGTSKVPLQGFSALEGMSGPQRFQIHQDERSTDRLPSAHTCFNQLDLPAYETYDKLRMMLLKAIHECSEGFGFA